MAQGGGSGQRSMGQGRAEGRCRSETGARRAAAELGEVQVRARRRLSQDPPHRRMKRKPVADRIIDAIEWLAATFVGLVAANIFIAVLLRKFFDTSIPDSYDFGRQLL